MKERRRDEKELGELWKCIELGMGEWGAEEGGHLCERKGCNDTELSLKGNWRREVKEEKGDKGMEER